MFNDLYLNPNFQYLGLDNGEGNEVNIITISSLFRDFNDTRKGDRNWFHQKLPN